jgi:hypothetical protein
MERIMSLNLPKIKADGVGSVTLVGVNTDTYPCKRGNCFSVYSAAQEYRILNFNYENLEYLLNTGVIQWPIDILIYETCFALIHDARVPEDYYQKHFCEVCCPENLLPISQRLVLDRMTLRGEREVINHNRFTMIKHKIKQSTQKLDEGIKLKILPDMINLIGIDVDAEMRNFMMKECEK